MLLQNIRWLLTDYTPLYSCNRPWRSIGLWDVEVPTFSRTICSKTAVSLSALRVAHPLTPEDSWYSFLLEVQSTPEPPPTSAEVKKTWIYTSTSPYIFTGIIYTYIFFFFYIYTALYPIKQKSPQPPLWEHTIIHIIKAIGLLALTDDSSSTTDHLILLQLF
jgi:hypothetical protein